MTNAIQAFEPARMRKYTYRYETPLGTLFEDFSAETDEDADRKFWSRHPNRDVCRVLSVSATREPEGEERAENRADGRGDGPRGRAGDQLGPVPAPACERDERRGDGDAPLRAYPADGDPGIFLVNKRVEHHVLLLLGEPDKVKVTKLSKHCYLVRDVGDVLALHPGDEVSAFARVRADSQEVDEQVGGDWLHGEAPSGPLS